MSSTSSFAGHRTGYAHLPLHGGKAPRWLFERMVRLAREICFVVVEEQGSKDLLRRLCEPYWFQALGCVLGFDWHSSGVTTTVCGAIKEGVRGLEEELDFFVAGGKGKTSRKTPAEIEAREHALRVAPEVLTYASRMAAKVDNAALQDGYQLYHHTFFFTRDGQWTVVQQGMNDAVGLARRYHWLGEGVQDFVCEPHAAICSEEHARVLNLVARESAQAREVMAQVASQEKPEHLVQEIKRLQRLDLPHRHHIELDDIHPDRLKDIFLTTYAEKPPNFVALLGMQGVGLKTLRALSLITELVYGVPSSIRDPARFSFAHGGKDGYPYPVDRETYDQSIQLLRLAVRRSGIGLEEKRSALNRLGVME